MIPLTEIFGHKFGKWTVLEFFGSHAKNGRSFLCKCDCGITKVHTLSTLRAGNSTQCKSCRSKEINKAADNLIGKKFGSWIVLDKSKNDQTNHWYYKCMCDCGTSKLISRSGLKNSSTTKCKRCAIKTHGMSYTNIYKIWQAMFERCFNKNNQAYKYYGARGITISEHWFKFENFYADMGERPSKKLSIDRINNDGNYEPGNCRWATAKQQLANRRKPRRIQ